MKKSLFFATALIALASCTSDEFAGDKELVTNNDAITIGSNACSITRATSNTATTVQGKLDGQFKKIMKEPVRRVMAAHWLVPRKALEKVGLFDKLFPLYGNDDNWCDRARYHGFKIGIVPEAKAVHDRAKREEAKEKVIYRNYYMGSLVRLCDINRPLWERFLFVCLFTLVKAAKYGSILPFKHFGSLCRMLPEIRQARKAFR